MTGRCWGRLASCVDCPGCCAAGRSVLFCVCFVMSFLSGLLRQKKRSAHQLQQQRHTSTATEMYTLTIHTRCSNSKNTKTGAPHIRHTRASSCLPPKFKQPHSSGGVHSRTPPRTRRSDATHQGKLKKVLLLGGCVCCCIFV